MPGAPLTLSDPATMARRIVEKTGGDIRLALPLGLGKANTIVNALTHLAIADRSIRLHIFTALTLQRPRPESDLQARFLGPAVDRLFGAYTPLDYTTRLSDGTLPDNIEVQEFFFQAGTWLGNAAAQQGYIAANYTHALHVLMARRPNVIAQLVARDGDRFSLSGNTDITADMLHARAQGEQDFILAGEINPNLPFMPGAAEIGSNELDWVLDDPATQFELFSVPKRPVAAADHAIGLHVAGLVPDGGTLQIGIGSIGDAVAASLMLRHRAPDTLRAIMAAAPFPGHAGAQGGRFEVGLYGVTEMLVQGIVELVKAGIIRREVDGAAVHAGFFVDCHDFYRSLREMPEGERARIQMMPVSFTNQLYGDEQAKRAARLNARFVNAAMKATLLGGVTSDVTDKGQIVSGVGGQFNFVDQAFALHDARAIITLHATRESKGDVASNIVWDHPHETIPRHYRDIIVTEYGVADLRGRSDAECVMAMISIADSRFQPELLERAKAAGKLPKDAQVPQAHQTNTPEVLRSWIAPFMADATLARFPFGTDFTEVEQSLLAALAILKAKAGSRRAMAGLLWRGLLTGAPDPQQRAGLERLSLDHPRSLADRLTRLAVKGALKAAADKS
ncbi:Acetyl-CoA hydrolase/transferase C-terminal domain-containing protein [Salinihabitans flavidus]|uniref:Acetyl-CoA hydrolase/transferase C-terminal domain-containing protein n=1 Tax=Salinihabitans flavidus TaxID=569882 RepID=A0A1H8UX22_9RHOB|nr:acetyl-CoA hydrolase/transferase C-terminal domain-containing protein [Salinihabitans flavidus]SEP07709.1 Acetyl-CoA hydrolase/transferase C-terminal domain-containing protein [Salinihabitans flavidus]